MGGLRTRLTRLERTVELRMPTRLPMPRFAGKPLHVAIADYADWLEWRLDNEALTEAQREGLAKRIDSYRRRAADARVGSRDIRPMMRGQWH
jgi:hypothetical protein